MFGTTIKLNIDHRVDMYEKQIVMQLRQEHQEVKDENDVLRNDIKLLEDIIETTGVRERALAKQIEVLQEEI